MNVLTPIGNEAFINSIQGVVILFVVIYKFTNIVYRYFCERENRK